MRKFVIAIISGFLLLTFSVLFAQDVTLKPYQKGDWIKILNSANGKPLAIHFWGVTCPTCVKEMPQWGNFVKSNPNLKIVFIQVDDVSLESIQKMLKRSSLEHAQNYYISGPFDERLRYEIDPKWHGETPTTVVIDQFGRVSRKTGSIHFSELKAALLTKTP